MNKILSVAGVAGLAKASATPFASPIPWRKAGIKYSNNEIYFDVVEELDAIVSRYEVAVLIVFLGSMTSTRAGVVVSSTVWGKIKANCRLSGERLIISLMSPKHITSGTPDLLLTFFNAQVLSDCSFHPCVR